MASITLEHPIVITDNVERIIRVSIVENGCVLTLTGGGEDFTKEIPWDKIDDVEYLSILFDNELVKTFKQVIIMLGKVYANKALYTSML